MLIFTTQIKSVSEKELLSWKPKSVNLSESNLQLQSSMQIQVLLLKGLTEKPIKLTVYAEMRSVQSLKLLDYMIKTKMVGETSKTLKLVLNQCQSEDNLDTLNPVS
jgi:hypothetical protein